MAFYFYFIQVATYKYRISIKNLGEGNNMINTLIAHEFLARN